MCRQMARPQKQIPNDPPDALQDPTSSKPPRACSCSCGTFCLLCCIEHHLPKIETWETQAIWQPIPCKHRARQAGITEGTLHTAALQNQQNSHCVSHCRPTTQRQIGTKIQSKGGQSAPERPPPRQGPAQRQVACPGQMQKNKQNSKITLHPPCTQALSQWGLREQNTSEAKPHDST